MIEINMLFEKLSKKDSVDLWIVEANKAIQDFAEKIQPQSPYKDKAVYNKKSFAGKFWTRKDTEAGLIYLYGISPNLMFMKGAKAPQNKWHNSKEYFYQSDKTGKFYTMRRAQTLSESPYIDYKEIDGMHMKGFFTAHLNRGTAGEKKLIFGRSDRNKAIVMYAKYSFADYLYKHFKKDIDRIIIETGNKILSAK